MFSFLIVLLMFYFISFFFFKQKTAYEMRISDWSSDVCSSDLHLSREEIEQFGAVHPDGTAVVDPRRDLKSPQQGAATTIWCATSPALASFGGVYCEDCDIAFIEADGELGRSEEHTSELQSLMRNSYAVFCLKKKNKKKTITR